MPTDDLKRLDADELGQYVPAVYARSAREAEQYAELLADHGIPSVVDADYEPGQSEANNPAPTGGVPVLVPGSLLDDARDIVAEFEEMAPYVDEDDQPAGSACDDEEELSAMGVDGQGALLDEEEEDAQPVAEVDLSDDEDDDGPY